MENRVKINVDFFNLSPYVRFIHEDYGLDDYKLPPRIIYDNEIIFVLGGTCHYLIEGKEYVLKPGDIHFMKPYVKHSCFVPRNEHFHYYAVHFDLIYMGEALDFSPDEVYVQPDYLYIDEVPVEEELLARPIVELNEVQIPYLLQPENPQPFQPLFQELLELYKAQEYGSQLFMRAILLKILGLMLKDITTQNGIVKNHPHKDKINEAMNYIYRNYGKPDLSTDEIILQSFLSPNYFRTLFKSATGKSIMEFVTYVRLEKAKELLREGNRAITDVCYSVGYQDIHYFSKLFKKYEGLSPKHYLNQFIFR